MMDNWDLTSFYGRGTELHTGLENAYQQFDHDLKRKSLLVLYSNGLSLSKDAQVLEVAAKYPGPELKKWGIPDAVKIKIVPQFRRFSLLIEVSNWSFQKL